MVYFSSHKTLYYDLLELLLLFYKAISAGRLRLPNGEKRINHLWMSGYLSIFADCK